MRVGSSLRFSRMKSRRSSIAMRLCRFHAAMRCSRSRRSTLESRTRLILAATRCVALRLVSPCRGLGAVAGLSSGGGAGRDIGQRRWQLLRGRSSEPASIPVSLHAGDANSARALHVLAANLARGEIGGTQANTARARSSLADHETTRCHAARVLAAPGLPLLRLCGGGPAGESSLARGRGRPSGPGQTGQSH